MPRKPKRPCSHPGCPNLTDGRFCEEMRNCTIRIMRSMSVINILSAGMEDVGRGSEISMYHSIRSVNCVMRKEYWWRQRKSITKRN